MLKHIRHAKKAKGLAKLLLTATNTLNPLSYKSRSMSSFQATFKYVAAITLLAVLILAASSAPLLYNAPSIAKEQLSKFSSIELKINFETTQPIIYKGILINTTASAETGKKYKAAITTDGILAKPKACLLFSQLCLIGSEQKQLASFKEPGNREWLAKAGATAAWLLTPYILAIIYIIVLAKYLIATTAITAIAFAATRFRLGTIGIAPLFNITARALTITVLAETANLRFGMELYHIPLIISGLLMAAGIFAASDNMIEEISK